MYPYARTAAVVVGLLASVRASVAHSPPPPSRYRLGALAEVTLPAAAARYAGPAGLFVSATAESLASALADAGWRHATHAPAAGASASFCRAAPHAEGAAAGDRVLVWTLDENHDGPGYVFFVRLVHDARESHAPHGRADAGVSLNAIFLTGTSRLGLARPVHASGHPLAWVRLRHAAGELRLALEVGEGSGASSYAATPSETSDAASEGPTETPSASTNTAGADATPAIDLAPAVGPGSGAEAAVLVAACTEPPQPRGAGADAPGDVPPPPAPRCEAHAALPLHPLSADKIAGSVVWHNASDRRQLALTFDACSTFAIGRFNPRVIAALRALGVPSTLFVGGHWAEMYPDVLETLAQDPLFEIGNHTYSHPHLRELSAEAQRQELLWTQELIFERTGRVPRLLRPPYGEVDDALITNAAKIGLYTVEYDLPAGDADDHVTTARLSGWVVGRSTPGSIVVMHMCRPNNHTAEALYQIVPRLRAQGFTFCQVSDMLFNRGRGCR